MIFNRFQAPEWYKTVTKDESSRHVYGIGPYRFIEWRPGIDIQMEIYEDYVPNPDASIVDGQAPHIKYVTNTWRNEPLVRSAMVETGEAEWAADIGFENKVSVPQWKQSGTTEVYALIPDIMWHPELKKKEVREALNLAIDCEAITEALLEGLPCWGNISPSGSAGLTPENTAPYPYDPARAMELLEQAGYDKDNKIIIYSRPGNCCRDLEFQEAVVQYWQDVGVNAEFQLVERTRLKELTSSGCGRFKDDESYIGVWDCAQRDDPPGPAFTSSHTNVVATSTEQLDVLVRLYGRMNGRRESLSWNWSWPAVVADACTPARRPASLRCGRSCKWLRKLPSENCGSNGRLKLRISSTMSISSCRSWRCSWFTGWRPTWTGSRCMLRACGPTP